MFFPPPRRNRCQLRSADPPGPFLPPSGGCLFPDPLPALLLNTVERRSTPESEVAASQFLPGLRGGLTILPDLAPARLPVHLAVGAPNLREARHRLEVGPLLTSRSCPVEPKRSLEWISGRLVKRRDRSLEPELAGRARESFRMTREQLQACNRRDLETLARDAGMLNGWKGLRKEDLVLALLEHARKTRKRTRSAPPASQPPSEKKPPSRPLPTKADSNPAVVNNGPKSPSWRGAPPSEKKAIAPAAAAPPPATPGCPPRSKSRQQVRRRRARPATCPPRFPRTCPPATARTASSSWSATPTGCTATGN